MKNWEGERKEEREERCIIEIKQSRIRPLTFDLKVHGIEHSTRQERNDGFDHKREIARNGGR